MRASESGAAQGFRDGLLAPDAALGMTLAHPGMTDLYPKSM